MIFKKCLHEKKKIKKNKPSLRGQKNKNGNGKELIKSCL